MKRLFRVLGIVFLITSTSCVAQKTTKEIKEVVFSAHTRGSSETITVVNYNVFHKTQSTSKTHFINADKRKAMEDEIAKLEITTIGNVKAPSNKRAFDGAMHARVTIKIGNKTYVSSDFDDHNPPKVLAPLVTLLRGFVK